MLLQLYIATVMIYAFSVFLMYYAMRNDGAMMDKAVMISDKWGSNANNPNPIVLVVNGVIPIYNVLNALVLIFYVFVSKDLMREFIDEIGKTEEGVDKDVKNDK